MLKFFTTPHQPTARKCCLLLSLSMRISREPLYSPPRLPHSAPIKTLFLPASYIKVTEPRESETYFIDRDLNRVRADKAYRYILENPKTPLAGFTLYLTQPSQMRVEPNFDGAALSDIVTLLRKTGLGFQASSPTTHEDLSKNLSQYLKKFGLETPVINQLCDQITHKVSLESTESAEP